MRDYLETIQDKLVDIKTAVADAAEENRTLRREIDELKRMADFGNAFELKEGVYWRENVPYCPVCWEVDRKPVRLAGPSNKATGFANMYGWECCFHKIVFSLSQSQSVQFLQK